MTKKKIIVAGAGHGGLVAAAKLAENGYDVTVYEAHAQKDMGYDWTDCLSKKTVRAVGLTDEPKDEDFGMLLRMGYYASSCTTLLAQSEENAQNNAENIERKILMKSLIKYARACGAKIKFGVKVLAPIIEADRVVGIVTDKGEQRADLVIDAAGASSPVRSQLPEEFGIENSFKPGEVLYAYRGIFEKTDKYAEPKTPYEVFLYLLGTRGLSWCITEEDSVDMLIGCFAPIDEQYIEQQLQSFRIRRPQLGRKLLRGGSVNVIPTRRPLSQFVYNGYAAVGDSAFMTEPMTGSGINLSMKAGMLLVQTVLNDTEGKFTLETLWSYNRDYILNYGIEPVAMDILKNVLLGLKTEELDFLLDNHIITEKDMMEAGSNTTMADILSRVARGFRQLPVLIKLSGGLAKGDAARKIYALIPESYDKDSVEAWKEQTASTALALEPNN